MDTQVAIKAGSQKEKQCGPENMKREVESGMRRQGSLDG